MQRVSYRGFHTEGFIQRVSYRGFHTEGFIQRVSYRGVGPGISPHAPIQTLCHNCLKRRENGHTCDGEQLASNPGPLSRAHTKTEENRKKRTWLQAREQSDSSQKPQDSISGEACISLTTLYMAVCLASFLSKIYSLINPYMYMYMYVHVHTHIQLCTCKNTLANASHIDRPISVGVTIDVKRVCRQSMNQTAFGSIIIMYNTATYVHRTHVYTSMAIIQKYGQCICIHLYAHIQCTCTCMHTTCMYNCMYTRSGHGRSKCSASVVCGATQEGRTHPCTHLATHSPEM